MPEARAAGRTTDRRPPTDQRPVTEARPADEVGRLPDTQPRTDAGPPTEVWPDDGGARGRGRAGGGGADGPGGGAFGAARRHPVRAALAVGVLAALAFVAVAVLWYEHAADPGPRGAQTIITVSAGDSMGAIAGDLAHRHVVSSSLAFRIYLVLHGTPVVQPGGYLLYKNDTFAAVRARLGAGPDVYSVTVLPGFTVSEVAQRLGTVPGHDGAHFLTLSTSGTVRSPYEPPGSTSLEGLLGTGTYVVLPGESDQELLQHMIDRFTALAQQVGLTQKAAVLGQTPYQAITVASIVQKEGVYSENLGKVARVIDNRLARGSPLQMDSTVLYSEHRDGGKVTAADLALNTPYNTYLHPGLTPTPICFPSPASLEAALAPTPGDWLYFVVVSKDGTEAFSDSFAGQQANESLAQSRGLG